MAGVTQTIILAAGSGSRLGAANGVPKPLMEVGGVPLVGHALRHARVSGCREAVVVVGHEGARVRSAVERMASGLSVRFITLPDASQPNGVSLLAAESLALPQFFLQMVDHVFAQPVLPTLIASPLEPREGGRVLVDGVPSAHLDLDDATRVRLAGDRVVAIGKDVRPWDAIDAGCFVLTSAVFDALRRVAATEPRTVSSGMRQLAARGALSAVDLGGVEWADVDTPADQETAERLLLPVEQRTT